MGPKPRISKFRIKKTTVLVLARGGEGLPGRKVDFNSPGIEGGVFPKVGR